MCRVLRLAAVLSVAANSVEHKQNVEKEADKKKHTNTTTVQQQVRVIMFLVKVQI